MSDQDDKNSDNVAPYVSVPCDDGHYGLTKCGKCGEILSENPLPDQCPECGVKLEEFKQEIMRGGQDAY